MKWSLTKRARVDARADEKPTRGPGSGFASWQPTAALARGLSRVDAEKVVRHSARCNARDVVKRLGAFSDVDGARSARSTL